MPQTSTLHAPHGPAPFEGQAFHRPRTSLGAAGHWVKTAGILAPLVIHEVIADPDKKWRAIRISALATALLSEALWTRKITRERQDQQERIER
jgi:hypothetical protein